MSNKKLSGKALVIQITREETRVGLVRLGQANPDLQASVILPTPDGAVEDGEIRNLTDMKDLLRPVLDDPVFRRIHRCVFVLCSSRVISSSAKLPAKQKGKRLDQVLRANMDEYFPIQTEDYLLTWEQVGQTVTDGFKENMIQMWAVPRLMVSRYYELAAGLGLTVAAVDYCGNSAACAAGVSFVETKKIAAANKAVGKKKNLSFGKKKGKKAEQAVEPVAVLDEPVYEAGESTLYLHVDDDSIITTFVTNGQVKMQRLVQRGFSLDADLGETAISMEYFNTLPETAARVSSVVLSGSAVGEVLTCGVEDILGVAVDILPCMPDPSWALVLGASRTKLDFGIPELSRDGSEAKLWQFPLVFAGAAALMAVIMLTMTSSLTWTTELGSLRNTQNQMMILAQQNSGAADDYHAYESAYNAYSSDWNALQGSIRTYNDNLGLLLDEFESKIPSSATVTTLQITDQSLSAQLAFQKLEDVAYFIQTIRDMQYATRESLSSVSMGPYYTAEMLRAMQSQATDASGDLMAALGMAGLGGDATGGLSMEDIMAMVSGAQADTNKVDVNLEDAYTILNLFGVTEKAPGKGSFETGVSAAAELEAPPVKGGIEDIVGALGVDLSDTDTMLKILQEANGGKKLTLSEVSQYLNLMEHVKNGEVDKVDPELLTNLLNAAYKNNGGSGNKFTEAQVELLLGLITGNLKDNDDDDKKNDDDDDDDDDKSSGSKKEENVTVTIKDPEAFTQMLGEQDVNIASLRLGLQNLTKEQLKVLQDEYGTKQSQAFDKDDLEEYIEDANLSKRKDAIESLLYNNPKKKDDDPAAMYHFFLLLKEDEAKKNEKDQILYPRLEKKLDKNEEVYEMLSESTQKDLDKYLDKLISMLTQNQNSVKATEQLIMTDDLLSSKLAAHLAYSMKKILRVDTSVDMDQILKDLETGDVMKKDKDVQDAVLALLSEKTQKLYLAAVETTLNKPQDSFDINDLLGNLSGGQPLQPEIRYFITVSFSYDDSLILEELQRKGLDFSVKVPGPLSVDAAQEVSQ